MTFRARLFLAIFFFSILPLAYVMGAAEFVNPYFIGTIFALCVFVLLGAMAGAVKVDELVKSAENRAIRSEVELQVFMERVQEGIFSVGPEGRIREINTAMAQFLRYDVDFLKGKPLWDYLRCDRGAPCEGFVPSGQVRTTVVMAAKDTAGGTQDLLVDLYVQKKGSKFDGFRGCARPVAKALVQEKLKQSLAVDLFRSVKSKLNDAIMGIQAAVQPGQDPAAAQAALESAARRTLGGLASCFDEGAPLTWKPKLARLKVHPRSLLEAVRAKFEPAARCHGQTIKIQCIGDPPAFAGDADYLAEMLGNLVDNALKYSPDNAEIELVWFDTDEKRGFGVWDRGIGLSDADMSRLFMPFFRADNSVNARVPGLGLGLWAARQIAEAHKGILTATSELGKGATFTFALLKDTDDKQIKWID